MGLVKLTVFGFKEQGTKDPRPGVGLAITPLLSLFLFFFFFGGGGVNLHEWVGMDKWKRFSMSG